MLRGPHVQADPIVGGYDGGSRRVTGIYPLSPVCQRSQDGVEDVVEIRANICCQKAQNEIVVLLKQHVLATVATVRIGVGKVLIAVKLDCYSGICTETMFPHPSKGMGS